MTDRHVLVGVTGGIAAYKTAMLVSRLVQQGASAQVVMTSAAERFVSPVTFAALSGRAVARNAFDADRFPLGAHITLAEEADAMCVVPASADFLAKAAQGFADDLLSTLVLAADVPILLAPAMNSTMWEKPAVQRNLGQLREDGFHIVDPGEGWLSCRQKGPGRMAEVEVILEHLGQLLAA